MLHGAAIPKLFLETTLFNFYFYGKAKEKMIYTRQLFDQIAEGIYKPYTSGYVVDELQDAPKKQFEDMYALIDKYGITILSQSDEIDHLASIYVANEIIPVGSETDAAHIAATTVNQLDFVVSYNMGHIVKQKTMVGTGFVNKREGYAQIGIANPKEVVEYDKRRTA
jgi:hypothetical protein